MPSAATLGTFALAATALILLPGPAMLFLISRGIGQGMCEYSRSGTRYIRRNLG